MDLDEDDVPEPAEHMRVVADAKILVDGHHVANLLAKACGKDNFWTGDGYKGKSRLPHVN